jgi:hypothetical protein
VHLHTFPYVALTRPSISKPSNPQGSASNVEAWGRARGPVWGAVSFQAVAASLRTVKLNLQCGARLQGQGLDRHQQPGRLGGAFAEGDVAEPHQLRGRVVRSTLGAPRPPVGDVAVAAIVAVASSKASVRPRPPDASRFRRPA